jgi:ATP-binding cassette subfamily B protein
MIAKYYGRSVSLDKLRDLSDTTRAGSNLQKISEASEKIGFKSLGVKIDFENLKKSAPLPCICYWNEKHFVVV